MQVTSQMKWATNKAFFADKKARLTDSNTWIGGRWRPTCSQRQMSELGDHMSRIFRILSGGQSTYHDHADMLRRWMWRDFTNTTLGVATPREHRMIGDAMTKDPQPPRNRDQDLPPRKGDTIEPTTTPERSQYKRERDAPLPEEETYERESGRRTDKR
jgi:hypothetical protein